MGAQPIIFINKVASKNRMAQEKLRMPMSTAGITSFHEEYRSKIEFKPGHVVVMCILVMLIVIVFQMWGAGWLGLTL